jgi:hypothetical protein
MRPAARAQVAAQGESILAGQHQVEHDQVEASLVQRGAHLAAISDRRAAQALLLQVFGEQVADLAVVIDDEDVVGDVGQWKSSAQMWQRETIGSRPLYTPGARRICIAVYP